ncbi:hypothetical protein Tco_1302038 [Tanacetum coccineum]
MYYKKNVDYVELLWEDFTYQIDSRARKNQDKMKLRLTRLTLDMLQELHLLRRHESSRSLLKLSTVLASPEEPTRKSKRVKRPAKKSSDMPIVVALTKEAQYEEVRKKSLRDFHKSHPSGSGIVTKITPSVAKIKPSVTSEGTGVKPEVPDHEIDENESGSESDQEKNEDDEEEEDDEFVKTSSNNTDDEYETKIKDTTEGDEDEGMDYTTNQFDDDVDLRMNEPVTTDKGFIQKEGTDARMTNIQHENENPEITLNKVIEDAHVTLFTVPHKTEVSVTSSSHSSDLASKFLNFSDIPHIDAEIVSSMDVHLHHEVPSNQTPTLLTVPVSVITESSLIFTTVIPQSLASFTPIPQQSTPTLPPTIEATNSLSILPNFSSVFQFNNRVTTLEKEVTKLKRNDPLNTQVTALVDKHLDSKLGATKDEFMSYLSASITARITEQVKSQLLQILPKEVSNFAPSVIKSIVTKSLEHAVLAKESSQPKSTYEVTATITEFELKKILTDKMDKSAKSQSKSSGKSVQSEAPEFENKGKTPQQGPTQSWLMTLTCFVDKPSKTFDELMSTPIDFSAYIMNGLKITNLTQETLLGPAFRLLKGTRSNYAELEYDFEECYKALSEKLDWDNPEGSDYPFDLTKPLPLIMNGNRQMVPVDYFFNNDLKYLQGGILTMTYTTFIMKTKAEQYDLPCNNDMDQNIWSPVKVAYDKHALWGISHWRDQRKTFYGYARGLESTHDVYSTKRIMAMTRVEEGDFLRLRINDIEDMLILIVKNRLTNLSDDDLGVKSYQKKINVTKPETTRPEIKKKDPYTPYQDPQGFIYVDTLGRNMLMRSDELYKFSDGTLIRLQTSLDDITKNI